jgi:hypothetical protein
MLSLLNRGAKSSDVIKRAIDDVSYLLLMSVYS